MTLSGSDPGGSALTYAVATAPAHGTLTGAAPNLTYTPTAGYAGADSFTFTVQNAGGASATATISITVSPAQAQVTLGSSLNPSVFGQSLTLTATVTGADPTGTVTFKDGAATLGTSTLTNGTATFATAALAAGAHGLTASYSGDVTNLGAGSGTLTQTVGQDATATTLAASASLTALGKPVTLKAVVAVRAPGAGTPTGTVTFSDGGTVLGTGTLNNGTASLTTTALAAGAHGLTASYGGDGNDAGSASGPASLVVAGPPVVVSLAPSRTSLWPPDGRNVPVTLTGRATDSVGLNSGASYSLTDNAGQTQRSGGFTLKANGTFTFIVNMAASRIGPNKLTRVYTVTVTVTNKLGLTGKASVSVTMPHSQ